MLMSSWVNAYSFEQATSISQVQEVRYNHLLGELRCLVCQNQSLADSNAPLALDLKREVYDQIKIGKTDDEIKTFLVSRYGEYILFKPQFTKTTFVLWLGPVVFLVGSFIILFISIRRQKTDPIV
jgi:cytochrome c-type biogenesis protein CcmH